MRKIEDVLPPKAAEDLAAESFRIGFRGGWRDVRQGLISRPPARPCNYSARAAGYVAGANAALDAGRPLGRPPKRPT